MAGRTLFPSVMLSMALSCAPPAASAPAASPGVLERAIEHYRTITSYRVTIRSFNAGEREHIVYYYRKPGFVRMEFIRPHAGALLVYNPETRRVTLWPFGAHRFPRLDLSPDNPLIRGSGGQRVDRSDVGALFANVQALQRRGSTKVAGSESNDGHCSIHLVTTGAGDFTVSGVHRYELWLDAASEFPVKVVSEDKRDEILETVLMEGLELDPPLPDALFSP